MEVLDSLWNLLTTENEMLTKIITAPTVIIEAWLLFIISTSFFRLNYSPNSKILYIILMSINSLITEFIIPSPYNIFTNYIFMIIIIKQAFNLNFAKCILVFIATIAMFGLIGSLILKPFLLIFNITYEKVEQTILYRSLYLAIHYCLTYLVSLIPKKKTYKIIFEHNFSHFSNKKIILINVLLGIFTLCVQQTIIAFYTDVLPIQISILSFISLLIYFFISFYSLTKTMKLQETTLELQNAEHYNKTLSILYDNVKAFKHDFDNMVFTIGGFVNNNDIDGLKLYYESLERECQVINNISLLNPNLINNSGIYNLLATKYKKAKASNVYIQLDFFFDFSKLHMPIYDFSRMLGIFLDNAIEASSLSNERSVKLMFRDSTKSNTQIIQIENSYLNKTVDTKKIFDKGITEKENHLGMGLWEVKQILKRNNNINLITEKNDEYFKQLLEIYY